MIEALRPLFEEQLSFRLQDGTYVEGSVFIGEAELLPVETLRADPTAYRSEYDVWYERWLTDQRDRLNEVLQLHANANRFKDLCSAVLREQAIPLVGSGMSVSSGFPSWSSLLRAIQGHISIDHEELEVLLVESKFEEAADLIASGTNTNLLNERVEHELRIDDPEVIDGAVRLLPAIFPNLVITTNLDEVLEHCYRRCSADFSHVLSGGDIAGYRSLKSPRERFLLKLHGDCRHAETRVLKTNEYDSAYAPGSVLREELSLLYRIHHILFLGCSLGPDRTVGLISEVAATDAQMPKHFALLKLPADDATRMRREDFLTERGIFPIWYDGSHDGSTTALLAGLLDFVSRGQEDGEVSDGGSAGN